jgi:hypothetical protein
MHRFLSTALMAVAALAGLATAAEVQAQVYDPYGPRIVNYNLYANAQSDIVARAYPSPRPTPAYVGHTYITYEPLAPHEFLYRHQRLYVRPHSDGRSTVTRVFWW